MIYILENKADVTNYYYQNGMVLYTSDEKGSLKTFNYYGADNNVIGSTRYDSGDTAYYGYNKDIQGSTTNIIDNNGNTCIGYTYDDFGTATAYNVKSSLENEITYTGAVYDRSTGLYYMNARYYDSEIGRFISQDTYRGEKDDMGTWHLYTYCANDPINYVDPSGHLKVLNNVKNFVVSKVKTRWFIAGAINWALSAIIGGSYAGVRAYLKKIIKNNKKEVFCASIDRVRKKAAKRIGAKVADKLLGLSSAVLEIVLWRYDIGGAIFDYGERKIEKNKKTWGNSVLDI